MQVSNNGLLADVDALASLASAGALYVDGNESLSRVSLPALASLGRLELRANPALASIDGLTGVQSVEAIVIADNEELRALSFAPNLESASLIDIHSNANLATCEAWRFADGVDLIGSLVIVGNDDAGVCEP